MRSCRIFAAAAALLVSAPAVAQDVKVAIGISGWTGFAPLTLANQAGIFKKNGLDVTIKKIPQKDRHLAVASGDIQCAATTVETWISWNANGVATKQIFQLDKSYGADGMATRTDVASIKDLKGKTVAASAPGRVRVLLNRRVRLHFSCRGHNCCAYGSQCGGICRKPGGIRLFIELQ